MKDRDYINARLAKFDYDRPIDEWPEEEIEELLDLVAQLPLPIGEALRKYRDVEGDDGHA